MKLVKNIAIGAVFIVFSITQLAGQDVDYDKFLIQKEYNPIRTTVPFLMIAPDSRAAGMGDAGVATTPDESSIFWNPAKMAFIKNDFGVNISYTPWLRELIKGINLYYLSGHYRIDKNQVIGASLKYFSLGSIEFRGNANDYIKDFTPNEFVINGSYARKLGKDFSMAMSAKYIHSNLTGSTNDNIHPGNAFAFDLGMFYNSKIKISNNDATMSYGLNFSNIGSKMSYSETTKNFIPMNMRLGAALNYKIDDYNSIGLALDFNKLLVPTTTWIKETDENGRVSYTTEPIDDISVASAIFKSFGDAPGVNGMSPFREELSEINSSIGFEYWYDNKLSLRTGFFYEPKIKGNRKYFTIGVGLRLNVFGLDVAYLIPTAATSPLDKTIRFSLLFNFDAMSGQ